MNKINNRTTGTKLLALLLVVVMMVSLLPMAVFAGLFSVSAQADDEATPYRIVMLDCGRKYFSVDNIKNLINTMAQYGYNQLTLAFGNGGCRFLLDDMSLNFGSTTMTSNTVKANITAGNDAFNGDNRYLTQSDMDTIINYATKSGIEIVPLLNMPGHASAILYNTSYTSNGNLSVNDETSRKYGYALLGKYVNYFKDKGCKYFHFGADESGFSGSGMSTFLKGCADVITEAGMTPRMFNDAADGTNTIPTGVEITYWYQDGHQSASTLANSGYDLINTHGRWYYVIKSAQNSEINEKYWQGTVNSSATSVELPVMKQNSWGWIDINTFNDNSNSNVENSLGTMFCIWCDASQDTYLTDSDVISYNQNYGALYQLKKLAEHYWLDDIKTDSVEGSVGSDNNTSGGTDGNTQSVTLNVGESKTFENVTADAKDYITGNNKYIATAKVAKTEATTASVDKVTSITSGKQYIIGAYSGNYVVTNTAVQYPTSWTNAQGLQITNATINTDNAATLSPYAWTITESGSGYTVMDKNGKYLSIDSNNNVTLSDTVVVLSVSASNSLFTFSKNGVYLDNFGGSGHTYYNTFACAWTTSTPADNNKWYLYEITEESTDSSTLTIKGVGEGTQTVTVGDTTYNITVTAPSYEETKTLTCNGTMSLPEGATNVIVTGDSVVSYADGKLTAGDTEDTATVTFNTVNVGNKITAKYTYTVNVTTINFEKIDDLTVQLWITNTWVGENEAPSSLQTVNIKAKDAYGEDGVLLKDLDVVPDEGYKKDGSNTVKVTYWKGTLLETEPVQQGADLSGSGFDFTYIRYWNNTWEYSPDGEDWDSYKSYSGSCVVAYYLQINNVSPEITTGTRDYGNPPTSDPGSNSTNGFAMTAFAVVYPDGSLSRTEQQMYETGMMRGFWESKEFGIGLVFAENNSNYKVSKMTVTWGTNIKNDLYSNGWYTGYQSGTYGTDWGVKWNKVTNSAGVEWYDETTYWEADNDNYSSIPMIDGDMYDLKFNTTDHHAVLILIYLETVETDDSLKVIYWDDNANAQITTNDINIAVKSGTTFHTGLKQTSSVPTTDNTHFTLDADACISNSSNVNQGFNTVISTVPGVSGVYLSGMYDFKDAHIQDDGKTLVLHYTLSKPTNEKTYVVDFGLPLVINFKDALGFSNSASIDSVSLEVGASTTEKQGTYGYAKISNNDTVTYTLNKVITGTRVTIPLYIKLTGYTAASLYQIHIIPASTVYYEDSFVTTEDGKGSANGATWGTDTDGTTHSNVTQALEALGEKTNVYGYDNAYNNGTQFSMGSANKVTVTSQMNTGWTDGSKWPTATFTFKGTGFDLISLTDKNSGLITYTVTNTDTGNVEMSKFVNNYYGYNYDESNNTWSVVTGDDSSNALYQIPVVKVSDLPYANYKVSITVAYGSYFDMNNDNTYSFWLDGVRVYNTRGSEGSSVYSDDNEAYPQFFELRTALATLSKSVEDADYNGVFFIDGSDEAQLKDYTNYGPNHEVYLANEQSIAFKLSGDDLNKIASVQLGAKAVNGGNVNFTVATGNKTASINVDTATDLYYAITDIANAGDVVTITNTGDSLLSLTTVKVTFNEKATVELGINYEEAQAAALSVRAMFAMPALPETFEPETFKATFSPVIVKEGKTATLTVTASEDVYSILINGEEEVCDFRTRTVTTGWGSNRTTVTYHVFTYTVTATETADYSIVAVNADGAVSEEITATLTVWQGFGNWFKDIIGRFF